MKEFVEFPQLETERLILREMTVDDVEFYFRHFNNNKIVEGSCFLGPENLEAAKEELKRYCTNLFKENRGIRWGIVKKRSIELVGTCGYYDWDKIAHRAEIGYDLTPVYWGQGIMTEALSATLEYGFRKMELNRIQAIIDSKNVRSIRLVERLGFKREGVLRQNSFFIGRFLDDIVFSLLKKEWTRFCFLTHRP